MDSRVSTKKTSEWTPLEADLWRFVLDADYEFTKVRPQHWWRGDLPPRRAVDRWIAAEEIRATLLRHDGPR